MKTINFNSSNPFVFNSNKLINNIEINDIKFLLKSQINDFLIEFSHQIIDKDYKTIYYDKDHYNILGYGVLNGRNIDINIIQKKFSINSLNSFSIYFRDIESRELIDTNHLSYIIDLTLN